MNLEHVHLHAIYRVHQIYRVHKTEYGIRILVAAPQQYVKTKQVTHTHTRPEQTHKRTHKRKKTANGATTVNTYSTRTVGSRTCGWPHLGPNRLGRSVFGPYLPFYCSKGFALTWYRALTSYSSPARPFAAPDVPLLVTGQQGSPFPACQQLSRTRNVCAGGSSEGSTNLKHGTKLGRRLASGVSVPV